MTTVATISASTPADAAVFAGPARSTDLIWPVCNRIEQVHPTGARAPRWAPTGALESISDRQAVIDQAVTDNQVAGSDDTEDLGAKTQSDTRRRGSDRCRTRDN